MKINRSSKTHRYLLLFFTLISSQAAHADKSNGLSDDFIFDETMFRGTNVSQSILERLTQNNTIEPGHYDDTQIIMNSYRVGYADVMVSEVNNESVICLSQDILKKAGFVNKYIDKLNDLKKQKSCVLLAEIVPNSTVTFNSDLALDFKVPQFLLRNKNEIEESSLNRGESVIFSNYTFNYFHNKQTGSSSSNSDYGYLSLNSGLNLGLWQFRHLSSYSYNRSNYSKGSNQSSNWYNIATYLQRPLYSIQSTLLIGKTNTKGLFFSGLNYNGFNLSSDERMYPSSQQGYAPVVAGIAKTNALVEVRQSGALIYQTNVPPGPFEIRDINPTSYNGNLNVTVIEADGSKNSFVVPFAAVPDSVRPGKVKYSVSGGRTRDLVEDKIFVDSYIQYGLNNAITLGTGTRLAQGYRSVVLSTVFSTKVGAFGFNTNYSNANLEGKIGTKQGWMVNLTYSKTLQPTNTNISLAGYRYSTEGYREFSDFINERYYLKHNQMNGLSSSSYMQKYRLMASIYQPLGRYGNLSLSASTQEYRNGRSRDLYYQMTYTKTLFDRVNMNLSVSRQKTISSYNTNNSSSSDYDTLTMLSFTIPFGWTNSTLSSSMSFDKSSGNQYQTALSGSFGDQSSPYNYSLNMNYDEKQHQTAYSANLNKQYSIGSVNINAAKGNNYTQFGTGITGAFVLHRGGLILGPYLGDTFAIVEAKGAAGAKIYNGQGSSINQSGYALVPSLVPYRYNSVAITSDGMEHNNVDIESSEQKIAPYSGAAVKIKFNTNQGYPLLISFTTKDDMAIPIGSIVTDEQNRQVGLVGQNNQAYLRTDKDRGTLKVMWGNQSNDVCIANYSVPTSLIKENLIKISTECR